MNSPEYHPVKTIRLLASQKADLDHASTLLVQEKIVALPTETVYGLAANGLCESSIRKIFLAKNRPLLNPLILHTHDSHHALALLDLTSGYDLIRQRFLRLAKTFWPGPLTIIAKKARQVPLLATANQETVAVRVPANESTRAILRNIGFPLVMPSANLSTRPSPTCAEHVLATLDGRIDAVVDDGPCGVGIESCVVKIDEAQVKIVRPGVIDAHALSACLGEHVHVSMSEEHDTFISPGQSRLHYSPKINAVKICTLKSAQDYWFSSDSFLVRQSDFLLLTNLLGERIAHAHNFLLSDDAKLYAQKLYEMLYEAEQNPALSLVIVLPDETSQAWSAILDRLKRTARA